MGLRPVAAVAVLLLAQAAAAHAPSALDEWPALLLVGDSTLAPQTGYGDALCAQLRPGLACLNLGRGGRSTHSYRAEGLWDRVLARLRHSTLRGGHVVLIQFGHNDQPGKSGRSTDLATTYPANLERYVADVRAAGATPVLATPLTRRSFRDGRLQDDLQPWADSMATVARRLQVPLVDLHTSSRRHVQALGPHAADQLAQGAPGTPAFDRTHVGERGGCVFAALLADDLARQVPRLAPFIGPAPDCQVIAPPAATVPPPSLHRTSFDHPGWAVGTMGGRGGRVERVTSLAARGPGSLRAALEGSGPRQIVFEVGGVVDLEGEAITLHQPFVTVAGQTAPSPGITLIRGELNVATHDVIVQHLRVRPGAWGRAPRSGGDQDGLSTQGGAHHVIVDHCSFSWATDENLSISGPRFAGGDDPEAWRRHTSHSITYSHNLVYEGLAQSVHTKGEHSKGTLVHDNTTGVLLLGNLYASNRERNALFKGGVHAAMVNNLVFNPGTRAVHYNLVAHEWEGRAHQTGRLALVGNVLRHGPDTRPGTPLFTLGGSGDVELHLADNLALDAFGRGVPLQGRYTAGRARVLDATATHLPPRLPVLPAAEVEDQILLSAGARAWDRDEADLKLLSDVAEGRGQIIDSETQSSGHPRHTPTLRAFDAAAWQRDSWAPRDGWPALFKR